jgi:DNA-directed RNA polymerase subunit RPC12/RpoP
MEHSMSPESTSGFAVFEKACAYCGARFRVVLSHQPEADHSEEYACPECGKHYEAEAAQEPEVRLVGRRTDGKRDRYQETMF